jgi:hypothetical protein
MTVGPVRPKDNLYGCEILGVCDVHDIHDVHIDSVTRSVSVSVGA